MTEDLRKKLDADDNVLTPQTVLELMREDFGIDESFTDRRPGW